MHLDKYSYKQQRHSKFYGCLICGMLSQLNLTGDVKYQTFVVMMNAKKYLLNENLQRFKCT